MLSNSAMSKETELPWIQAGYTIFSEEGEQGLKIENIAKQVQKSKSSFYHLFGSLERFVEVLLEYHVERGGAIAHLARQCQKMDPDVLQLLVEIKEDILFNRQLRVNRHRRAFNHNLEKAHNKVEEAFFEQWTAALGLQTQPQLSRVLLDLIKENFYLRITPDNLHYDWLRDYMKEIQLLLKKMQSGTGG